MELMPKLEFELLCVGTNAGEQIDQEKSLSPKNGILLGLNGDNPLQVGDHQLIEMVDLKMKSVRNERIKKTYSQSRIILGHLIERESILKLSLIVISTNETT